MRDTVNAYEDQISNAKAAYESKPVLVRDYYEAIDEALTTVLEEQNGAAEEGAPAPTAEMMPPTITDVEYENGTFTFPVTLTTNEEFSQKYPAALVQYLYDKDGDKFSYVEYTGYTAAPVPQTEEAPDASGYVVGFELKVQINNEKQLPDFAAEAKAEADAEAAESDTGAAEAEAEEAE